jgi:hypothetical protein
MNNQVNTTDTITTNPSWNATNALFNNSSDDDFINEMDAATVPTDDSLYIAQRELRTAKLAEDHYLSTVSDVLAEKMPPGNFSTPWVRITIYFKICIDQSDNYVLARFISSNNLSSKGRMYPIVKGILGSEPGIDFNFKDLIGRRANVTIKHRTDEDGNVWDNVVEADCFYPSVL